VGLNLSLDYGLTLLAAALIGTGFVLQQQTAQAEPASRFLSLRLITDLLRQRRWLAGIGAMIAGQILAAWSIGNLSLAFVEPLLTTNLVFALVLAVPIAKASLRLTEILGAVVLCTGVALLSASRSAKAIGLSFGSITHWPAAAVIAAIAFAAVYQGRRHPGRGRAMLTGTGAGLVFGIQDALTRQTLELLSKHGIGSLFTHWAPYALVGAGAVGIWLMQSAFNSGPLPESLPAIAAGEPLVGILLGVLVFGDRIQITPGELALQACGIVALIVGVIIVGRAPALSQLRTWSPPSLPHITGPRPARPGRARVTRGSVADELAGPDGPGVPGQPNGGSPDRPAQPARSSPADVLGQPAPGVEPPSAAEDRFVSAEPTLGPGDERAADQPQP
jgi:drug/metabolite transporter (DMT)-like permease